MKSVKKLLSFALVAVMLVSMIAGTGISVSAAISGKCGDNATWLLNQGVLTISGSGDMYDYGDPEQGEEAPSWLKRSADINTIIIKDGINYIGAYAFSGLDNVTSVTISGTVDTIAEAAFSAMFGLTEIVIPEGVAVIDNYAFSNCASLVSVTFPSTLQQIFDGAFQGCMSLTSVDLSDAEGLRRIGTRAFSTCIKLAKAELPDDVVYMGDAIFHKESYYQPVEVVCTPGSKTAELILNGSQCGALSGVKASGKCGDNLSWYLGENGVLTVYGSGDMYDFGDPEQDEEPAPWDAYSSEIKSVVIGDGVTSIGSLAFCAMAYVADVTIGDDVKTIGEYAFSNCTSLASVKLPSALEQIGAYAFQGCTALANVDTTDAENLTSIGTRAFSICNSLDAITLPGSVTEIGEAIFFKETYYPATKVTCPAGSKIAELISDGWQCGVLVLSDYVASGACGDGLTWALTEDGVLYIYGSGSMYNYGDPEQDGIEVAAPWYGYELDVTKIVIGDNVTSVGDFAFGCMPNVTEVVIGDSVKTIGDYSFPVLDAITELVIPEGVTVIGEGAFHSARSLTSLTLPSTLKEIGDRAFWLCPSITEVIIPDGVTTIGKEAFAYCTNLEKAVIPDSVTYIGKDAFLGTKVVFECSYGSYAAEYAEANGIEVVYGDLPVLSVDEYTVSITNGDRLSYVRFALGEYATASEVKWAPGCVTMSASKIATYLVDGTFVYELPEGGLYTFWLKLDNGEEFIVYADATNIVPYVSLDGVRITIGNLYGVKDVNIAKGECTTFDEIRANRLVHISETRLDGKKSYMYEDITKEGTYTVCIRFDDGRFYFETIVIDVLNPCYTLYGLQATIGNLEGVKLIRTAYGEHTSVSDMKKASGYRTFAKKYIKGADEYMIQYREGGTVTVAVHYENGYSEYMTIELTKIVPTYTAEGNTVTIGNLDRVVALRYAPGTFTTSSALKRAPGMRAITPEKIEDGKAVVTLNAAGTYTFYAIYDDESESFVKVTVK